MSDNGNIDGYLPPDISRLIIDYKEGGKRGEPSRIDAIDKIFCWMPGWLNCFTGWANHGKTNIVLFLMLVKAKIDGCKFILWSPEMIDTIKTPDGKMVRSAHRIYNPLVHALTGVSPYKWADKQLEMDKYLSSMAWIEDHFKVLDTWKDKTPKAVINGFRRLHDSYGTYAFLVDPFKNLSIDEGKLTKDRVLESVFSEFEDLALETNMVGNFIAHPKSMPEKLMRKNGKLNGPYKEVSEHDLLGGSVWSNSMDGVFSYYRQEKHINPNSPLGTFICWRQRSQELTNEPGKFENIFFDKAKNRFYFNGVCPLDGSLLNNHQTEMKYENHYEKMRKAKPNMEAPLPTEPPF